MMITLYADPYIATTGDANKDAYLTNYAKAFLKECNFLWGAKEYVYKFTTPEQRGIPDGTTGVPADTVCASQGAAVTADNALMAQPTTFIVQIGAKNTRNDL